MIILGQQIYIKDKMFLEIKLRNELYNFSNKILKTIIVYENTWKISRLIIASILSDLIYFPRSQD